MKRNRANSFIKKVLYRLKRLNGESVDLYLRGTVSSDVATGNVTIPETKWTIDRAIVLPIDQLRNFVSSPPWATAGRQFEFGGFYGTGATSIIVDIRDLPLNYTKSLDDAFIMDHVRFQIKNIQAFRSLRSFIFIVEELIGQPTNEIFEVKQNMSLTDSNGVS